MAKRRPSGSRVPTFRQLLGGRLKTLREQHGCRQEVLALVARRWGLPWRREVVTMLEAGRRHLTTEEWLLLPTVMTAAFVPPEPFTWTDLVRGMDHVALTPELNIAGATLESLVTREGVLEARLDQTVERPETRKTNDLLQVEAVGRRWWPGGVPPSVVGVVLRAAAGEAERKAARVLDVTPLLVALAAVKCWGRPLTDEREDRIAKAGAESVSARVLQARRGHVTRTLLAELRSLLDEATRRKPQSSRKRSSARRRRRRPTD